MTWPTFSIGSRFLFLFVCVAVYFAVDAMYPFSDWPVNKTISFYLSFSALTVGLFFFVSAFWLREGFEIQETSVTKTRWPSVLRPSRMAMRENVINAIVRLTLIQSRNTTRIGEIKIRVRTGNGIQWWSVGGIMGWSEANFIGHTLQRYMSVRFIEDSQ